MSLPPDLAEALAAAAPRLGLFAGRVQHFTSVGSTNDVAARLASGGAEEGTAVIADLQTAGRGRLGRQWFSPPGAGLYVSVVFRPPAGPDPDAAPPSLLPLALGVALAEGLRTSTGLDVHIKWPNDLVVVRRKLAGILAEGFDLATPAAHIVAGFGINLRAAAYPPAIAARATSVEAELGRSGDRGVVLAEVLAAIAAWYRNLVDARFGVILSRWQELAPSSRGTPVEWAKGDRVQRGITAGIDRDGALLVTTSGGVERVTAGEVHWP